MCRSIFLTVNLFISSGIKCKILHFSKDTGANYIGTGNAQYLVCQIISEMPLLNIFVLIYCKCIFTLFCNLPSVNVASAPINYLCKMSL